MAIAISSALRCNSSLEQALDTIAELDLGPGDLLAIDGWVHVNPSDLAGDWERTVARVDHLLNQHNLRLLALNTGVQAQLHHRSEAINAQRLREFESLVRFMKRYAVTVAAIQPRNADPARPWREVLRACVATLREQLEAGRAAGVDFALELHVNSPFETLDQARALLDELPDLPLVYDPSHFVMQGLELRTTGWLMAHARHVHLRDADAGKLQTPFGAGSVDFDWVLNTLKEHGYRGHFSIEYLETGDFDVLDSVRRLHETIARHFPA